MALLGKKKQWILHTVMGAAIVIVELF
jgi:hypothetical protein